MCVSLKWQKLCRPRLTNSTHVYAVRWRNNSSKGYRNTSHNEAYIYKYVEIFVLKSAQWWYSACISIYTVSDMSILPVICMPTTPSNIAMNGALKHQDLGEWRPPAVRNRPPIHTNSHFVCMSTGIRSYPHWWYARLSACNFCGCFVSLPNCWTVEEVAGLSVVTHMYVYACMYRH